MFIVLLNDFVYKIKAQPPGKGGQNMNTQDAKVKTTERGMHDPETIPEIESGGTCFGLPDEECPQSHPDFITPGMTRECKISFCDPLCLNSVKCHIIASGEFAVAASGEYSDALCRQVIGQGCLDNGCCKAQDDSGNHI